MDQDEVLRTELLRLFKDKVENYETLVDEFIERIDDANEIAMTRIARANTATEVEESTEETPVEETVEEVVEEADVIDENVVVEEEEETVEDVKESGDESDDDIEVVLDETFIHDLVASPEFTDALRSIVDRAVKGLKTELETRFRSLEEEQEAEREWQQDTPSRTKRAVVSYRPRTEEGAVVEVQTLGETAANSANEIWD